MVCGIHIIRIIQLKVAGINMKLTSAQKDDHLMAMNLDVGNSTCNPNWVECEANVSSI